MQGVGFRPYVYRLAVESGLAGWVGNTPEGVMLEAEGSVSGLEEFERRLMSELPPAAFVSSLEKEAASPENQKGFFIEKSSRGEKASVPILSDLALCRDCLREMNDPSDRRYRYPFITCTNCGPRFTIMTGLPYDRPQTTMKDFPLCAKCIEEYENPLDRRFHAQPLACPECGPGLEFLDGGGGRIALREEALSLTIEAIREGKIVAIKGLGGFHLVCDARNKSAVRTLRERKNRPAKPFAVMMPSLEVANNYCEISIIEGDLLTSQQSPIVIVQACAGGDLSTDVAPGNPTLGIMLPYTPLHHLLMNELGFPVIATSGNRSGEPICTEEKEALTRLKDIADLFLIHNRPIAHRNDDSIVRVIGGKPVVLRRARGYAPLPLKGDFAGKEAGCVLAMGAHLKNTVAVSVGGMIVPSPHVGDLDTPEAVEGHDDAWRTLCGLYEMTPQVVAHDAHPDYHSTRQAKKFKDSKNAQIQHHYAHALACMADNRLEGECLAIVWDGTGYGDDGNIWGGEFLIIKENGFERAGHFLPFRLPGGDAAAREPWRVAVSLLHEAGIDPLPVLSTIPESRIRMAGEMISKKVNSPISTSAGRLFDGISSILGLCQENSFEGEAAIALEFNACKEISEIYTFETLGCVFDWRPVIKELIADSACIAAAKFHNTLARMATDMAKEFKIKKVLLTGGCFQNKLLAERIIHGMKEEGIEPFWHGSVPPNDGGIAVGQALEIIRRNK